MDRVRKNTKRWEQLYISVSGCWWEAKRKDEVYRKKKKNSLLTAVTSGGDYKECCVPAAPRPRWGAGGALTQPLTQRGQLAILCEADRETGKQTGRQRGGTSCFITKLENFHIFHFLKHFLSLAWLFISVFLVSVHVSTVWKSIFRDVKPAWTW